MGSVINLKILLVYSFYEQQNYQEDQKNESFEIELIPIVESRVLSSSLALSM
jgi:hypothetical protein